MIFPILLCKLVKKRGIITCEVHAAEAYTRPHRSVYVLSDLAIRNTAHRPFTVRTLPVTAARVFSPSPLPVTSLFTSLLLLCCPLFPPPALLFPSVPSLHHPIARCRTAPRRRWTGTSAAPCATCSSPRPSWPSLTTRARPTPRECVWSWGSRPAFLRL